jgi:hypothetical protein
MTKYENGYQSKIDYYQYKVNRAIETLDSKNLVFYATKLTYFLERQKELKRETLIFGQFSAS